MISVLGLSVLAVVNMELDDREEEAWSHSTVERGEASPTNTPHPPPADERKQFATKLGRKQGFR